MDSEGKKNYLIYAICLIYNDYIQMPLEIQYNTISIIIKGIKKMKKVHKRPICNESLPENYVKFIYSEKATKFCEIFTLLFHKILWPSQNIWILSRFLKDVSSIRGIEPGSHGWEIGVLPSKLQGLDFQIQ